jgi:predicted metal-dependent HD superfamily phosphohydrolase
MDLQKARNYIESRVLRDWPEGLSYHSAEHIHDVYSAAERLAASEGVNGKDLDLLRTAALYHDVGFVKMAKNHEARSCDIARESLPGFGYNDEDIERICGMIMATNIPQEPRDLLEEILADADLDYLGRDDFWTIGALLYNELRHYGVISNVDQWNGLQIRFLEQHHYFTRTALETRKANKDAHLALLKAGTAPNPKESTSL